MKALYTQTNIICKLKKAFFEIFSAEGKHTKEHLFDLLLSVLCLNGFQSISYNFEHFISDISDNKLNSYYFTLNESRIDLSQWMKNMVRIALSLIPDKLFGSVTKDLNVKKGYGIIGKKQNGEESEMPVLDTTFFSALMI